ncbi:uncharacterized protein LOC113214576 isoform X2 [Frankliniella occidentalis]|uniref:Uncharacterized protein LOC113214576 isoform X2 n=1 Tax=Frankliniella occidentalis TaxID=133901 RepID=A0A9C6X7W4_FRAOC|nr:uncharacterized protein LOC113214576 isoform X2 [Frankliniella occidentalis]
MAYFRSLFGLFLVVRAGFHMLVAGYAVMDLNDLHSATSGTFKQIALKLTHISDVVKEMELPLLFYVICGVILLILAILYPWKDVKRSRLSVYAILHLLYALMVVYVVYVRTIVDLSYVRDIYQVMCIPWLFPASLVLDVLTFIAACVPNNKSRTLDETNSNVFPMYRTSAAQANTALPISLIREAA